MPAVSPPATTSSASRPIVLVDQCARQLHQALPFLGKGDQAPAVDVDRAFFAAGEGEWVLGLNRTERVSSRIRAVTWAGLGNEV